MRSYTTIPARVTAVCVALLAPPVVATAELPDFDAARFTPRAVVDHPYFPLHDTLTRHYVGENDRGAAVVSERFELVGAGHGPVILGVQTFALRDRVFEHERLVEDTFDYYAQDSAGNVWYLGEDVTNYRYDTRGNLLGTDDTSAWRAGVNGARPGLMMPAEPTVGRHYYQEYAARDGALDQARVVAVGVLVGAYEDVVQILETTELEPQAREFKFYARGIGLVRAEEGLDPMLMDPEMTLNLVGDHDQSVGRSVERDELAGVMGN